MIERILSNEQHITSIIAALFMITAGIYIARISRGYTVPYAGSIAMFLFGVYVLLISLGKPILMALSIL